MTPGQALASRGLSVSQTCPRAGLGHEDEGTHGFSTISALGPHCCVKQLHKALAVGTRHPSETAGEPVLDSTVWEVNQSSEGGHASAIMSTCSKENKVAGSAR